jgi:nucleoside-diphosphate-sugar epimerase
MQKRVLVTGATGFLGRNVLEALLRRDDVRPIAACRDPSRLLKQFDGEIRQGDLLDPGYRAELVREIDVLCHVGTWGAFWGHPEQERQHFFEPARDLVERAIGASVGRVVIAGTVAMASRTASRPVSDDAPSRPTGFWPHLDMLVELDHYMISLARAGVPTELVMMRLGHFAGRGNRQGLVSALIPRLRTRLVPWLSGGRHRLALVADTDLGLAFALAAVAQGLEGYESFNICGPSFPTSREVFEHLAQLTGSPLPMASVPQGLGYAFAWLMEALHPVLPGSAPFLTRSLVHVAEDWTCATDKAREKLGYVPSKDWRIAVAEAVAELETQGYPWPALRQAT